MMTQNSLLETKECVDLVSPYVDKVVLVDGGSIDDSMFWFRNLESEDSDFHYFLHPWTENFSRQRNNYLKRAREVIGHDNFYCLVSDPDEFFEPETLAALPKIVDACEAGGYNMASFRCRSVTLKYDEVVWENLDEYWKGLLLKWYPDLKYVGNPHEGIDMPGGQRILRTNYEYRHQKQENVIWKRGMRNLYTGGGGPNLSDSNKLWVELKYIIKDEYGKELGWHEFHDELMRANVGPKLKEWLIRVRKEDGYDGSSEHRECYKYYFRMLHPEEEPEELKGEYIP